ncbi:MAG: peptidyl-prolyl cis-trans isomerase [Candidatus Krumholzibacteria bacterium]|nr:peptidyl-prolyl cis-trans isomerase [Candidatus Krumholzibacteria bacterium]
MFAKRALLFILIAGCVVAMVSSCSREKKDGDLKVKSGLAARVGDIKITEDFMLRTFEELPDNQKSQFKGPDAQAKFVDRLIEQHLLYLAALDAKMDKSEEIQERLRWVTMNILVAEYFSKKISEKIKVEPKEIEAYYASHPQEFVQAPVMRAQYIFTADSLKALKLKKRVAQGEIFTKLAAAESEDKATSAAGGDVGYFNPGGYIKGVSDTEGFSKAAEKLDLGVASGIVRLQNGFAIMKVTEKNPQKTQTLDEARRTIEAKLQMQKTEEAFKATVEELKKKYKPENYVRERLDKTTRTAEELWEMAQIEPDARNRIQFYRDIVNLYPTHKNAAEALFMIGFTYAEELKDFVQARRTFDELKQKYPQNPMLESAKWMSENMESENQKLETFEGVQKRMEEDKANKTEGIK